MAQINSKHLSVVTAWALFTRSLLSNSSLLINVRMHVSVSASICRHSCPSSVGMFGQVRPMHDGADKQTFVDTWLQFSCP